MKTTQPTPSTHERSELHPSAAARSEASAPNVAHTPGPWIAHELGAEDGSWAKWSIVAHGPLVYGGDTSEGPANSHANARLIAAAPELLAACQAIAALADGQGRQNLVMCAGQARAAIAKATASDTSATNPKK